MIKDFPRSLRLTATLLVALVVLLAFAGSAGASLGRVVAIGDSLASGMGLGSALPMVNPACGRTTGSYPERAAAKLTPSTFVDVTCNGGHSGVYEYSWTGLPQAPNNNGATIPPQYDALTSDTAAVILGTGGNEAYFGEVVKACTGSDANVNAFYHGGSYTNSCAAYDYSNATHNLLAVRVNNSKTLVANVLNEIHQRSPSAKIFLIGVPRVARPDGVGCMFPGMFMPQADGPVYATWEDGLRSAMISDVNAFNSSTPGNYARFVDAQAISGISHTMCESDWNNRWMNNWVPPTGVPNWGLELHNTPTGAEMISRAIVDSFHAAGLDTGSQAVNPTNPVVTITAPANNSITKNASTTLTFTATDNVAVASCTRVSPASIALSPGVNTITVSCQDHAGNTGQASVSVTRDNTPPSITIDSPQNGANTTASSIALNYSASDNSGAPSCSPATGSNRPLTVGANTLTVSCTDGAGNAASASVVVNRGSVPVVAISSPANGFEATTQTVNVAFTVGGVAAIPNGTTCTVAGNASSSANSNAVTLVAGSNQITVGCSNQFGPSVPVSVNVIGSPPSDVAITSPAADAVTTAQTVNVAYLVSGSSTIPNGTTCTVNGDASSSTTTNPVALTLGSNTITVTCTGAFGAKSSAVNITRGNPPAVAITAPTDGLTTSASAVNVSYTVNGASSIPGGTTCTVGGAASVSATTNSFGLSPGANTITVVCTSVFGTSTPVSVSATRGTPPAVAISSPADGANTTADTINVAFTVGGGASIPVGTSCSVNGAASSSATSNSVALATGSNTITVSCTNSFGTSSSPTINVNRGAVPLVVITAPANNSNTAASSINVAFTVNGQVTIPGGTSCNVDGNPSSTTTNAATLVNGSNTIAVVCSNAFGASAAANVTVNRGPVPAVAITAPADQTNTTASSINIAFTVDGAASIPNGTSCTVNDAGSSTPSSNSQPLVLGANTFTVKCSNPFGQSTPVSVTVNRGTPPVVAILSPADGTETTANSVNVAYTVNGGATIPNGTICKVGAVTSTSTTTNAVSTATLGDHTITVSCTNAFGVGSQSVVVTRGNGPTVAITPASSPTSASSVDLSFTVNGGNSIPVGVSCTLNGAAITSTTVPGVSLQLDTVNVLTVACTNNLGTDSKSITVERLAPAAVTITAPDADLHTADATSEVTFTVTGSGPPDCTVNSVAATGSAIVTLDYGSNLVTVTCTNRLGADTKTITIVHGPTPVVSIYAQLHTDTPAKLVNATYVVDGNNQSLPPGISCTVNGRPSASPTDNPVELTPGTNSVIVRCTNSYGTSAATVFVTYLPPAVEPAVPAEPGTPAAVEPNPAPSKVALKLSGKRTFRPARRGGMLLKQGARGGIGLRITVDAPAKVKLTIERLGSSKKSKRAKFAGKATLELPAGTSTARLSGRVGKHRLKPGRYRVKVSVAGTKLHATSRIFRVTR